MKETTARITIKKMLESAGWRFLPEGNKPANIQLELNIDITESTLDAKRLVDEHVGKDYIVACTVAKAMNPRRRGRKVRNGL